MSGPLENPILGLDGIQRITNVLKTFVISPPIIAIGGIRLENVEQLMNMRVHGIAVSSAINLAEDKMEAIKRFFFVIQNNI